MRGKRRDGNHAAIKAQFLKLGAKVWDCADLGHGFPDLVVAIKPAPHAEYRMIGVEIKDGSLPPSARALTKHEKEFHAYWPAECRAVVATVGEVAGLFAVTPHDYAPDSA